MVALFGGGWIGSLVGGVGGAIVGGIGSAFVVMLLVTLGSNNSARKPPVVRIDPTPSVEGIKVPSVGQSFDAASRLRRLDKLKADGVITAAEHKEQRRAIIRAV